MVGAVNILMMMTSSPIGWHKSGADARRGRHSGTRISSSRASPPTTPTTCSTSSTRRATTIRRRNLEKITAHLLAINSADDVVNPPELGIMEQLMPRVKHGRYILLPTTEQTRGHGTHSLPAIWGKHLAEFMRELTPAASQ